MTDHLITLLDWDAEKIRAVLGLAHHLKAQTRDGTLERPYVGRTLALLFEKASMRTRVSFEVAMTQLGGNSVYLSKTDVDLGRREPIKDGARMLAGYVDIVAARVYSHATVEELAAHSSIPVINALSDFAHPCQALADALTIQERVPNADGAVNVAFIGDGNNVALSLAVICAKLGWSFTLGCPSGYSFSDDATARLSDLAASAGTAFAVTHSARDAADGADVLYTDVWTSMGQEDEAAQRRRDFTGFTIDENLLAQAGPDAIVLHCLPAHRGEEITDAVIEGTQSAIFQQAENRLHAERALIRMLLG